MKKEYTRKIKPNDTYRPLFHLTAPFGWINDPNGFSYYKDKYHLFYQYNPKGEKWGVMHWGHAESSDLVNWKNLGIALYPDTRYDNFLGCFSGSAIEKDGSLCLMYTGVPFLSQIQLLAVSEDGVNFIKESKPVIGSSKRPPHSGKFAFRDPKILKHNDTFYSVIGASYNKGRQIALYKSKDLRNWFFISPIKLESIKTKGIFECPDLVLTGTDDILIYSIMNTETDGIRYQNIHSSVYELGKADLDNGSFTPKNEPLEFDAGSDFYAPQTTTLPDGRTLLVAWMQMWFRKIPTSYLSHGFAGMMTIPREISVSNNKLIQKPAREVLSSFPSCTFSLSEFVSEEKVLPVTHPGAHMIKISSNFDSSFTLHIHKGDACYTEIKYNNGFLSFNRELSGHYISGSKLCGNPNIRQMEIPPSSNLDLLIFTDKSSIEIFANNTQTMSNTIYPFPDSNNISISSEEGAEITLEFYPFIKTPSI